MAITERREQLEALGQRFVASFHRIYVAAVDYKIDLTCLVKHHASTMQIANDMAQDIIDECPSVDQRMQLQKVFFNAGGYALYKLKSHPERWLYHRVCCDITRSSSAPIKTHLINNNLVDF